MHRVLLLLLAAAASVRALKDIEAFGAVPADHSSATAYANADAIIKAFQAAAADGETDRVVHVPAGKTFYVGPVMLDHLKDFEFNVEGTLKAIDDIKTWPVNPEDPGGQRKNVFHFVSCENFVFSGHGTIDGTGYNWWLQVLLNLIKDNRPHLIKIEHSSDFVIRDLKFSNSPMFHLYLWDVANVLIEGIDIQVDVTAQKALHNRFGNIFRGIPLFPLNTDGIDPAGRNITIRNSVIVSFDDAVAVKPIGNSGSKATCSQDILVENVLVKFGVGMTIGSVPPSSDGHCIKNVYFRNIRFEDPIKAIYIKTNPGTSGFGIISNITYENIYAKNPLWWPVYIGPQQQKQPDGGGPGCMFFPIVPKCDTQPRITISDITLRNVKMEGALLGPGIVRCDPANPCKNINFDNVDVTGEFILRKKLICQSAFGTLTNSDFAKECVEPEHSMFE